MFVDLTEVISKQRRHKNHLPVELCSWGQNSLMRLLQIIITLIQRLRLSLCWKVLVVLLQRVIL